MWAKQWNFFQDIILMVYNWTLYFLVAVISRPGKFREGLGMPSSAFANRWEVITEHLMLIFTYFSLIKKRFTYFLLSNLEYLNGEVHTLSLNREIADNPYSNYPFSLKGMQKDITCVGCYFMEWESIGTYLMFLYTKGSKICNLYGIDLWDFPSENFHCPEFSFYLFSMFALS